MMATAMVVITHKIIRATTITPAAATAAAAAEAQRKASVEVAMRAAAAARQKKEEEDRKMLAILTKIEAIVGPEMHDQVEATAFLISLTSRDSSFLIRCAVSRDNHDFDILEEWEKGIISEHVDELKVKFTNAEPAPQNTDEFDQEKNMVYLSHLMNKLNTGYETQKVATENCHCRDYFIKARTNLCDVSIKPWAK